MIIVLRWFRYIVISMEDTSLTQTVRLSYVIYISHRYKVSGSICLLILTSVILLTRFYDGGPFTNCYSRKGIGVLTD